MSIRREVLLAVRLDDERFEDYGNEDVELALRLSRAGVTVRYCPGALADQDNGRSWPTLAADAVDKGRAAVLLATKRPDVVPEGDPVRTARRPNAGACSRGAARRRPSIPSCAAPRGAADDVA
jgi:hypothetical protein